MWIIDFKNAENYILVSIVDDLMLKLMNYVKNAMIGCIQIVHAFVHKIEIIIHVNDD